MKRLKLVIMIILMLSLTGCVEEYHASEKQSDEAAEYMAGVLLDNDRNYDHKLTLVGKTEEDSSDVNAVTQTSSQSTSNNNAGSSTDNNATVDTKTSCTLAEVIGKKSFDINFKDYKITDTYPENADNAYFTIEPRDGYQLLVASFTVKNITGENKTFDLSDEDVKYLLDINDGKTYEPLLTLLENDLQYIDINVNSGKTKKVLLIFEVAKGTDLSNMKLSVSNGNKVNKIKIK